jgi:hypothetical protein
MWEDKGRSSGEEMKTDCDDCEYQDQCPFAFKEEKCPSGGVDE